MARSMIIAAPGLGKSHTVGKAPDRFFDQDDIIPYEMPWPEAVETIQKWLAEEDDDMVMLGTIYGPGVHPTAVFLPMWDKISEVFVKRPDLAEVEADYYSWLSFYLEDIDPSIITRIPKGKFVSDYIL